MISWQRIVYMGGLALTEATLGALLLTVAGSGSWGLLVGVVLAGAAADWLIQRWLPVERQAPVLIVLGIALALWIVKADLSGSYDLLSGWDAVGSSLFTFRGGSSLGYLDLLVALFIFWRGTRLLGHDSLSIQRLFGRAIVLMLLVIGSAGLAGLLSPAQSMRATAQVLTFFATGLLTIALAGAADQHDTALRRMDWRGFLTLCTAVGVILVLALLGATLLGEEAALAAQTLWQAVVLVALLLLAPFMILLAAGVTWLLDALHLEEGARLLQQQQQQQQLQHLEAFQQATGLPDWVVLPVQIFCALVPLLLLVALFLFVRRRAQRPQASDEERQSLWSWSGLASDLRGMLEQIQRPFNNDQGLRGALARLRGTDPSSRIRRSYIRLLLTGEEREHPRAATQTPHEYEPTVAALLPQVTPAITQLTQVYERARYHPEAASASDATQAERAWQAINRTRGESRSD